MFMHYSVLEHVASPDIMNSSNYNRNLMFSLQTMTSFFIALVLTVNKVIYAPVMYAGET